MPPNYSRFGDTSHTLKNAFRSLSGFQEWVVNVERHEVNQGKYLVPLSDFLGMDIPITCGTSKLDHLPQVYYCAQRGGGLLPTGGPILIHIWPEHSNACSLYSYFYSLTSSQASCNKNHKKPSNVGSRLGKDSRPLGLLCATHHPNLRGSLTQHPSVPPYHNHLLDHRHHRCRRHHNCPCKFNCAQKPLGPLSMHLYGIRDQ